VIELIDFRKASVLQRRKVGANEIVKSWEDDYILLYRRETVPTTNSPFQTENIISKSAFYMKMMWAKGLTDFPSDFLGEIIKFL
jgi:hypothetical protein